MGNTADARSRSLLVTAAFIAVACGRNVQSTRNVNSDEGGTATGNGGAPETTDDAGNGTSNGLGGSAAQGRGGGNMGSGNGGAPGLSGTCAAGTFDDDGSPDTPCVPWTTCQPGTVVSGYGSSTSDRLCAPCAAGTQSLIENAEQCLPLDGCVAGTEAVSDETCAPCAAGTWDDDAAFETPCVAWTECHWEDGNGPDLGTATSDRACRGEFIQFGTAGADRAFAVALDPDRGSIYVAGDLGGASDGDGDGFLRSVTWSGAEDWSTEIATASEDHATAVAVDREGYVYVAGHTQGSFIDDSSGDVDAFLIKYDWTGVILWMRRFGGEGGDFAEGVTADESGVVVVGWGEDPTAFAATNAFVRKLDTAGDEVWVDDFAASSGNDAAHGVAMDPDGNVYVVGATNGVPVGEPTGGDDVFVRKYDPTGAALWTRQFGTPETDEPGGIAVDPTDASVYVVGSTRGDLAGESLRNLTAFVRKYDSTGQDEWTEQFGAPSGDETRALAVAADSGSVFVVGGTLGVLGGISWGDEDAFLRYFDSTGNDAGTRQFGTAGEDRVNALAIAGSDVVAVGYTGGALQGASQGDLDVLVARIGPR